MSTNELQKKAVKQFVAEQLSGKNVSSNNIIECIVEENDGIYYYKIKATTRKDKYWGSVPLSAWEYAIDNPDRFIFVIAQYDEKSCKFTFSRILPNQLLLKSYIPSFRFHFNIDLSDNDIPDVADKEIKKKTKTMKELSKIYKIFSKKKF